MADDGEFDWFNLKFMIIFIIVIAVIIAAGFASYKIFSPVQNPATYEGEKVKLGDQVTVDYIGMFEDGVVFDTSIEGVDNDNALYPKSLSYSEKASYSPLSFTVGDGQMIQGFDYGVIGMAINQTKVITVTPEEGYGLTDDSQVKTLDLFETFPVFEWGHNITSFRDTYYVPAVIDTTVVSNEYGWNVSVYHIDPVNGDILLKNEPQLNELVDLYNGWLSQVISIDTTADQGNGVIVVKHLLDPADAGNIISNDDAGMEFRVTEVDLDNNIITIDYNKEVVGRTLVFQVKIVSITTT
jgi:FKBP-type peptidyl-prolyl cis-trans isomerase 2